MTSPTQQKHLTSLQVTTPTATSTNILERYPPPRKRVSFISDQQPVLARSVIIDEDNDDDVVVCVDRGDSQPLFCPASISPSSTGSEHRSRATTHDNCSSRSASSSSVGNCYTNNNNNDNASSNDNYMTIVAHNNNDNDNNNSINDHNITLSTTTTTPMITSLKHLAFTINASSSRPLFSSSEINLIPGSRYGLVGPADSGKSALLQLVAKRQLPLFYSSASTSPLQQRPIHNVYLVEDDDEKIIKKFRDLLRSEEEATISKMTPLDIVFRAKKEHESEANELLTVGVAAIPMASPLAPRSPSHSAVLPSPSSNGNSPSTITSRSVAAASILKTRSAATTASSPSTLTTSFTIEHATRDPQLEVEARKILLGLGIPYPLHFTAVPKYFLRTSVENDACSNLQQQQQRRSYRKRLALACAVFIAPELLLLDGPTNHLDLNAVIWLESLLASQYNVKSLEKKQKNNNNDNNYNNQAPLVSHQQSNQRLPSSASSVSSVSSYSFATPNHSSPPRSVNNNSGSCNSKASSVTPQPNKKTLLVTSQDASFLDSVCSAIIEFKDGKLNYFPSLSTQLQGLNEQNQDSNFFSKFEMHQLERQLASFHSSISKIKREPVEKANDVLNESPVSFGGGSRSVSITSISSSSNNNTSCSNEKGTAIFPYSQLHRLINQKKRNLRWSSSDTEKWIVSQITSAKTIPPDFLKRRREFMIKIPTSSNAHSISSLPLLSSLQSSSTMMAMTMAMTKRRAKSVITFRNVSFSYPGCGPLFIDTNFTLTTGSRVCLVGPNGAGKSTLLKLMTGELQPVEGSVVFGDGGGGGDEEENNRPREQSVVPLDITRNRIVVFNEQLMDQLPNDKTPLQYLTSSSSSSNSNCDENQIQHLLQSQFGVFSTQMSDSLSSTSSFCSALPRPVKFRVALASLFVRAHARSSSADLSPPQFIIFDEPTTYLDMESIDALIEAINELDENATGSSSPSIGILVISHDARLIQSISGGLDLWVVGSSDKNVVPFVPGDTSSQMGNPSSSSTSLIEKYKEYVRQRT